VLYNLINTDILKKAIDSESGAYNSQINNSQFANAPVDYRRLVAEMMYFYNPEYPLAYYYQQCGLNNLKN
jgi:hypothetical protein